MNASLRVYLGDRRVAELLSDNGKLLLQYDAPELPALSVRLPARAEPYGDAECRAFFVNLLPEGSWRQALCRQLGIAQEDDFALLAAIGADCAGAVALSPERAWKPERGRYVETSLDELTRWVKNPAARPRLDTKPGLRLSLAGAQDKLLIHLEGEQPYLCENGAPSTVILKPSIHDPHNAIKLSALNELFSMRLAAASGLRVPETFWYAGAFAVRRYDRVASGKRRKRLHQEDFAQVLGLPAVAKYDVKWAECFELVARYASVPVTARLELLDRLLFNLLLGNNDAHSKNFALLHTPSAQVELAPAYDLVCTQMYSSLSQEFAMPIGPAKALDELRPSAWRAFAKQAGVGLPLVRTRALELAARVSQVIADLYENARQPRSTLSRDVYPARRRELFEEFSRVVRANSERVSASFA